MLGGLLISDWTSQNLSLPHHSLCPFSPARSWPVHRVRQVYAYVASRARAWRRQWQPVLLPGKSHGRRSLVGCSPWGHKESDTTERLSDFTFHFHALEKEMATHSSVLAWRIPGTGEPGGLPSMGSHRVGHDWSDSSNSRARAIQILYKF